MSRLEIERPSVNRAVAHDLFDEADRARRVRLVKEETRRDAKLRPVLPRPRESSLHCGTYVSRHGSAVHLEYVGVKNKQQAPSQKCDCDKFCSQYKSEL
jgi:hypothetical protein